MNVLILGSGGREHAITWKMSQSDMVEAIFCLPGNEGMSFCRKTTLVPGLISDIPFVVSKAMELSIDLVIVGPEEPLSLGVTDALEEKGIAVFGPSQEAAKLESSKVFSKQFMLENSIPTARAELCHSYEQALKCLETWNIHAGVVIKADGLAQGKGVVVTDDLTIAHKTLFDFMKNPGCSVKTEKVLIEERLIGKEVSAFAICDGSDFIPLGYACDYKRVGDNDTGPNTGGMGGYSPKDWPDISTQKFIEENIFSKVIQGMAQRGTPYKGFLFAGLMIDRDQVRVIEFNVRMGDPETQILLPLVEGDLFPSLLSAAKGQIKNLGHKRICLKEETAIHVVATSRGYPSIDGANMLLDQKISYPANLIDNNSNKFLFLAGVRRTKDNLLVNCGGRVLGITAVAEDLEKAKSLAYSTLSQVHFEGLHFRRDIGT